MTQCEALSCIEVTRGEYLLVFNLLAVYVDASGRKSREKELMYPALPTAVGEENLPTNKSCQSEMPFLEVSRQLHTLNNLTQK